MTTETAAKTKKLTKDERRLIQMVMSKPTPMGELERLFPPRVIGRLMRRGLIKKVDGIQAAESMLKEHHGREMSITLQAPTMETLNGMVRSLWAYSEREGFVTFRVVDRGFNPGGNDYRAVVVALNPDSENDGGPTLVTTGDAFSATYGQPYVAATPTGVEAVAPSSVPSGGAALAGVELMGATEVSETALRKPTLIPPPKPKIVESAPEPEPEVAKTEAPQGAQMVEPSPSYEEAVEAVGSYRIEGRDEYNLLGALDAGVNPNYLDIVALKALEPYKVTGQDASAMWQTGKFAASYGADQYDVVSAVQSGKVLPGYVEYLFGGEVARAAESWTVPQVGGVGVRIEGGGVSGVPARVVGGTGAERAALTKAIEAGVTGVGATPAKIAEYIETYGLSKGEGVIQPSITEVGIPKGATLIESNAQGQPAIYEFQGEKYYAPGSTMYQLGFRTESEARVARGQNVEYGPHSGGLIPSGTVVVTDERGNALYRITENQFKLIAQGEGASTSGVSAEVPILIYKGQYAVPIRTDTGGEVLLSPKQTEELAGLKGEALFDRLVELGAIGGDSVFIRGTDTGFEYLPADAWNSLPAKYQNIAKDKGLEFALGELSRAVSVLPTTQMLVPIVDSYEAVMAGWEAYQAAISEGKSYIEAASAAAKAREASAKREMQTVYDVAKIAASTELSKIFSENVPGGAEYLAAYKELSNYTKDGVIDVVAYVDANKDNLQKAKDTLSILGYDSTVVDTVNVSINLKERLATYEMTPEERGRIIKAYVEDYLEKTGAEGLDPTAALMLTKKISELGDKVTVEDIATKLNEWQMAAFFPIETMAETLSKWRTSLADWKASEAKPPMTVEYATKLLHAQPTELVTPSGLPSAVSTEVSILYTAAKEAGVVAERMTLPEFADKWDNLSSAEKQRVLDEYQKGVERFAKAVQEPAAELSEKMINWATEDPNAAMRVMKSIPVGLAEIVIGLTVGVGGAFEEHLAAMGAGQPKSSAVALAEVPLGMIEWAVVTTPTRIKQDPASGVGLLVGNLALPFVVKGGISGIKGGYTFLRTVAEEGILPRALKTGGTDVYMVRVPDQFIELWTEGNLAARDLTLIDRMRQQSPKEQIAVMEGLLSPEAMKTTKGVLEIIGELRDIKMPKDMLRPVDFNAITRMPSQAVADAINRVLWKYRDEFRFTGSFVDHVQTKGIEGLPLPKDIDIEIFAKSKLTPRELKAELAEAIRRAGEEARANGGVRVGSDGFKLIDAHREGDFPTRLYGLNEVKTVKIEGWNFQSLGEQIQNRGEVIVRPGIGRSEGLVGAEAAQTFNRVKDASRFFTEVEGLQKILTETGNKARADKIAELLKPIIERPEGKPRAWSPEESAALAEVAKRVNDEFIELVGELEGGTLAPMIDVRFAGLRGDFGYGQKLADFLAKTYGLKSLPVDRMGLRGTIRGAGGQYFEPPQPKITLPVYLRFAGETGAKIALHELVHGKTIAEMTKLEGKVLSDNHPLARLNKLMSELEEFGPKPKERLSAADMVEEGFKELIDVEYVRRLTGFDEVGYKNNWIEGINDAGMKIKMPDLGKQVEALAKEFVDTLDIKRGVNIEAAWREFKLENSGLVEAVHNFGTLTRVMSPASRVIPGVVFRAVTDVPAYLRTLKQEGFVEAGRYIDETGRWVDAPRTVEFYSPDLAFDRLYEMTEGKIPKKAGVIATRTMPEDIGTVFNKAFRAEYFTEKDLLGRLRTNPVVLDELFMRQGERVYPTEPTGLSLSKRGISEGLTGETFTYHPRTGQEIPIIVLATERARVAGLGAPDVAQVRAMNWMAFKGMIADLARPHLPKRIVVTTETPPIKGARLIEFYRDTYKWKDAPKAEINKVVTEEAAKFRDEAVKAVKAREAKGEKFETTEAWEKAYNEELGRTGANKVLDALTDESVQQLLRDKSIADIRETLFINLREIGEALATTGLGGAGTKTLSGLLGDWEVPTLTDVSEKLAARTPEQLSGLLETTKPVSPVVVTPTGWTKTVTPEEVPTVPVVGITEVTTPPITPIGVAPPPPPPPLFTTQVTPPSLVVPPSVVPPSVTPPVGVAPPPSVTPPSLVVPPSVVPPVTPPPPPPPPPVTPPPPPPKIKEVEKKVGEPHGVVVWRQGMIRQEKGKLVPVWRGIRYPYRKKSDAFVTTKPPKGATRVSGIGSAYRTITQLSGTAVPWNVWVDMGAFLVGLYAPTRQAGKAGAIQFRRDVGQGSDIQLKGVRIGEGIEV